MCAAVRDPPLTLPPSRQLEVLEALERMWRDDSAGVRANADDAHRRMKTFFEEDEEADSGVADKENYR